MSLFGDLDIASANKNPFFKPDGTYLCEISEAFRRPNKDESRFFLYIKYTIVDGVKKGKAIQEWKPIPFTWEINGYDSEEEEKNAHNFSEDTAEKAQRNLSFLKARLSDFEIPAERMNMLDPEDILKVGRVNVTIKNREGNENVTGVSLAKSGGKKASPFS